MSNLTAQASTGIAAPVAAVWEALTDPRLIKQYMFGTEVVSDWQEGSTILWRGEYEGRQYEDKGVILKLQPMRLLQYSHYSPLSGAPDTPENYHTVTIQLAGDAKTTQVRLTQDGNASEEERAHSAKNWEMVLDGLKKAAEKKDAP